MQRPFSNKLGTCTEEPSIYTDVEGSEFGFRMSQWSRRVHYCTVQLYLATVFNRRTVSPLHNHGVLTPVRDGDKKSPEGWLTSVVRSTD